MQLMLRAFVAVDDATAATRAAERIATRLADVLALPLARVAAGAVTHYAKLPHLWECDLRIDDATLAHARRVLASTPEGWSPASIDDARVAPPDAPDDAEDISLVWNRGAHADLLDPAVHWAELVYMAPQS